MYTNVDSTTYATLTSTRAATTAYYVYIGGFNFDAIPSGAHVTEYTIKVKGYETGLSTSTSYAPRLVNWSSSSAPTISGAAAASSTFDTSTKIITVPSTIAWETLVGYGSNLRIRVAVRRAASNTQGYLYIYGAEILVNYTIPGSLPVRVKNNGSWVTPTKVLVKDGGTWKEPTNILAKSGGSWH